MEATFGPFTFDDAARDLRHDGRAIHLSPKAFELLALLLRARPAALSRTELHDALWPGMFVSDGSLAVLVAELRHALGDTHRSSSFIRTVNRFGYAFVRVGDEPGQADAVPDTAQGRCSLSWNGERVRLTRGEYLLGRAPQADIRISAAGVSRCHATILVDDHQVTLRDLASRHGTFVDDVRVTRPVQLADEARIRLGTAPLEFRREWPAVTP